MVQGFVSVCFMETDKLTVEMVQDCVSVFQGDRQVDTGDGAGSRGFCGHLHSDSCQTATRNPTTGE